MYAGKITLRGTQAGLGVRNAGDIGATATSLSLIDGKLVNTGNISAIGNADINIAATLTNNHLINAKSLKIKAETLSNTGAAKLLAEQLSVDAQTVENAGKFVAGVANSMANELIIKADELDNDGRIDSLSGTFLKINTWLTNAGVINSQANIQLESAGDLFNTGTFSSAATVQLTIGKKFDNQGILSAKDLEIQAARIDNADRIIAENSLLTATNINNSGKIILVASGNSISKLQITADSLTNTDTVKSVGDLIIQLQQGLSNAGLLYAKQLHLDSAVIINNDRIYAQALTINAEQITNNAEIVTGNPDVNGSGLVINGSSLTNIGTINSSGKSELTLTQNLNNAGVLSSAISTELSIQGAFTNTGTLHSSAAMTLQVAGELTNKGLINAKELKLEASAINNHGRIYADQLALQASKISNGTEVSNVAAHETGVIASRDTLNIGSQSIYNYRGSLIYSEGDLQFGSSLDQNNQAVGSADLLHNRSAEISSNASINITAKQIKNIDVHYSIIQQTSTGASKRLYRPANTSSYYDASQVAFDGDRKLVAPVQANDYYVYDVTRKITRDQLQNVTPAKILAAKNISIKASTLINEQSQIVAGETLTIQVEFMENISIALQEFQSDVGTVYLSEKTKCSKFLGSRSCRKDRAKSAYNNIRQIDTGMYFVGELKDNLQVANSGGTVAPANPIVGASTLTPVVVGDFSIASIDPLLERNFSSQLFQQNIEDATPPFLQTDPKFTHYRTWLNSDYMFNQVGLWPKVTQQRMGDGYVEQRLLQQQVLQLTGRRYLHGYSDDEAQYQALMSSGVNVA